MITLDNNNINEIRMKDESKAIELAFPSDAERSFFTLRSSLFT